MELVQTHLSWVHLGDSVVHKVCRPVRYDFVDLSTVERRRAACEAELRHNAPWAPDVYLGVVPVPPDLAVPDGWGVDECAVKMTRLPEEARLDRLADDLSRAELVRMAVQIKTVHARLERRPEAAGVERVSARLVDNVDELVRLAAAIPDALVDRVQCGMQRRLAAVLPELQARSGLGQVLHGDLRAEHVYLLADRVSVLDGVAFDPALAEGDPAEDVAFLVMDLTASSGRWDLEDTLWEQAGIGCSRALRDLYVAHRALIRAKVALIRGEPDRALARILHALVRVEEPAEGPVLIGVGGLPGTGKSTLAAALAAGLGADVVRTDVVRKRLGPPDYSDAGRRAVYTASLEDAARRLADGRRVIVDASFERVAWRADLVRLARRWGLRPILVVCEARARVVEQRLRDRRNDASDADVEVYRRACAVWEPPMPEERLALVHVQTDEDDAVGAALDALADLGSSRRRPVVDQCAGVPIGGLQVTTGQQA